MDDFYFCPKCSGLIEAGGDSSCICSDDHCEEDERGDWEFHNKRDKEAEELCFDEV